MLVIILHAKRIVCLWGKAPGVYTYAKGLRVVMYGDVVVRVLLAVDATLMNVMGAHGATL